MNLALGSTSANKAQESTASAIRLKTVIQRPANFSNHPAIASQQKRTLNCKSSIVGPTIKSQSRLSSYHLPTIQPNRGSIEHDEPTLNTIQSVLRDTDVDVSSRFWSKQDGNGAIRKNSTVESKRTHSNSMATDITKPVV